MKIVRPFGSVGFCSSLFQQLFDLSLLYLQTCRFMQSHMLNLIGGSGLLGNINIAKKYLVYSNSWPGSDSAKI